MHVHVHVHVHVHAPMHGQVNDHGCVHVHVHDVHGLLRMQHSRRTRTTSRVPEIRATRRSNDEATTKQRPTRAHALIPPMREHADLHAPSHNRANKSTRTQPTHMQPRETPRV